MMRKFFQLVAMVVVTISAQLASTQALAQMSEHEQGMWKKKLLGWEGIAAHCQGEAVPPVERVCKAVARELEFLTATGKIPFVYTGLASSYEHVIAIEKAGLKHPIEIDIKVTATTGEFIALYGQLRAGDYYGNAVDDGALKTEPKWRPKSGDFIIWDRGAIAVGPVDNVAKSMADVLKDYAKEFITLYVKYRRPMF